MASVSGRVRQRYHRRYDLEIGRAFREEAKPMTVGKDRHIIILRTDLITIKRLINDLDNHVALNHRRNFKH